MNKENYYTTAEAAEVLGVRPQTIRLWIKKNYVLEGVVKDENGYRGRTRYLIPKARVDEFKEFYRPYREKKEN